MKKAKQRLLLCTALVGLLFFTPVSKSNARETPKVPENVAEKLKMVAVVRIDGKSAEYNYIFINERRFRVSPDAEIIDYGGSERPLSWLPTPCRAEITYRMYGDHRHPLVEKIVLK